MAIKTGVVTGYGINAEQELGQAFADAGSEIHYLHVQELIASPSRLQAIDILAFPGGFAYGDHLGSGKVLSHLLSSHLDKEFERFLADGKLVLGICNGFQMITRMGLVPNIGGHREQEASLLHNDHGNFIDKWVDLTIEKTNTSPWIKGMNSIRAPIRHGEGRYALKDTVMETAVRTGALVALRYGGENPNGSWERLAGITDPSGQVLGMMPHPEAARTPDQDPAFRRGVDAESGPGSAMMLFRNAVEYSRKRRD